MLAIKTRPQRGAGVEVFSNDVSMACGTCGMTVHHDLLSCVQQCGYARACVGMAVYRRPGRGRDDGTARPWR